jgi:hypothetical protein
MFCVGEAEQEEWKSEHEPHTARSAAAGQEGWDQIRPAGQTAGKLIQWICTNCSYIM